MKKLCTIAAGFVCILSFFAQSLCAEPSMIPAQCISVPKTECIKKIMHAVAFVGISLSLPYFGSKVSTFTALSVLMFVIYVLRHKHENLLYRDAKKCVVQCGGHCMT